MPFGTAVTDDGGTENAPVVVDVGPWVPAPDVDCGIRDPHVCVRICAARDALILYP